MGMIRQMLGLPPSRQEVFAAEQLAAAAHGLDYEIRQVGDLWFLALHMPYTDLWAEDFIEDKWAWYKWKKPFSTKEEAEACAQQALAKVRQANKSEAASALFRAELPKVGR